MKRLGRLACDQHSVKGLCMCLFLCLELPPVRLACSFTSYRPHRWFIFLHHDLTIPVVGLLPFNLIYCLSLLNHGEAL